MSAASLPKGFSLARMGAGVCLAHDTLPVWIVKQPHFDGRSAFYQGYIAVGKLIKGRHPCMGGVDNRRVGDERGFKTLDEAARAAIAKAGSAS